MGQIKGYALICNEDLNSHSSFIQDSSIMKRCKDSIIMLWSLMNTGIIKTWKVKHLKGLLDPDFSAYKLDVSTLIHKFDKNIPIFRSSYRGYFSLKRYFSMIIV